MSDEVTVGNGVLIINIVLCVCCPNFRACQCLYLFEKKLSNYHGAIIWALPSCGCSLQHQLKKKTMFPRLSPKALGFIGLAPTQFVTNSGAEVCIMLEGLFNLTRLLYTRSNWNKTNINGQRTSF